MSDLPLRAGGEMTEIIGRYQNMVYGLALARTGSSADADDVFQEVFLAYFQSGRTFRDEEHRKAWLLRTAVNMSRRCTVGRGEAGVGGPVRSGGELPPAFVSVLLPGAVRPGDREGSASAPGNGAHAAVPGAGEAPGGPERSVF